jgi:transcriptional regulator with XRE-family HTH domain
MVAQGDLPATLKRLRVASGLTQHDVAADVGLTPQHVSDVERGKRKPSLDALEKLLALYGHTQVILPVAQHSEFAALGKPALLLVAQAGHDLAVAVDAMGDASTDLSVRMRQVERAVRRYWELLASLGIMERGTR